MLWINLKRILRTGFTNFWRNGIVSVSAVLVMVITLFIISTVIFTSALLEHTLNELRDKADVNINISIDAAEQDILKLKSELESLPEVESVEYITKEDALERFRERHKGESTIDALDELDENPLNPVLNVKAKQLSEYEGVQTFLEQNYLVEGQETIVDDANYFKKKETISKLNSITDAGEQFGVIVTIFFVTLSILITLNTIRLAIFISKDEIKVMNLVGAKHSYISGPFVVTGAMYGIFSAVIVLLALYPATYYFADTIAGAFFGFNIFGYYLNNFGQIFVIILFSGILIASISSFLAISRYLKKR